MLRRRRSEGDEIKGVVSGTVSGPVAIGKQIEQRQEVGEQSVEVTQAEVAELRARFAELRAEVAAAAPPEERERALAMVDELERDTVTDEPKPITMRYVRDWLVEHIPAVAGTVASVVVNPIVGKLVAAAGDRAAAEFQQLLGD